MMLAPLAKCAKSRAAPAPGIVAGGELESGRAGSGADRIVGAIRPGVRRGEAAYAAMT